MLHKRKRVRQTAAGAGWFCLSFFIYACLWSCTSPQAVATFAGSADKALEEGPAIFSDLHQSCLRRYADIQPITPSFMPGAMTADGSAAISSEPPVCARFGSQGEALGKASGILSAYFRAVQQLAAFNSSTVSSASEQTAENAASAASLNSTQVADIGKLAGLVTQIFTAHYQRSRLLEYLREADSSISSVTEGLETIASQDYEGLLEEERRAVTRRYQDNADVQNTALVLLLNRAYADDMADLNRREAAAKAYVKALQQIRAGHNMLAKNAGHLNAKDLSIALEPYTSELQTLLPALQKGF